LLVGLSICAKSSAARLRVRLTLHAHGYRSTGSFGWPGAYGTSWFADPVEDMIGLMLIQRRGIEAFPMAVDFERRVYDAIDD